MISVTRPGGSGFYSLTYQGQRLAYLRADPNETITMTSGQPVSGPSKFLFYEMWNAPLWQTLGGSAITGPTSSVDLLQGLQDAMSKGDLRMERILKSPTGAMQVWAYDLRGCRIQSMTEEAKLVVSGGIETSYAIQFDSAPFVIGMTTSPVPKVVFRDDPKPEDPGQPLDLSAPVYALRSFKLSEGKLKSLYREFFWAEGKAVAQCSQDVVGNKSHGDIPARDCNCGLYGLQSLDRLYKEYGGDCARCVAVFAAEGRTIIGDRGLKTKAARVVAYWVQTGTELEVMKREVPKAEHFEDMAAMLEKYHFPPWGTVEPDSLPLSAADRWKFDPAPRKIYPPAPSLPRRAPLPRTASARRVNQQAFQAVGSALTPDEVKKMLGDGATPGGIAAVHHALGLTAPVGPGTSSPKVTDYRAKKDKKA